MRYTAENQKYRGPGLPKCGVVIGELASWDLQAAFEAGLEEAARIAKGHICEMCGDWACDATIKEPCREIIARAILREIGK